MNHNFYCLSFDIRLMVIFYFSENIIQITEPILKNYTFFNDNPWNDIFERPIHLWPQNLINVVTADFAEFHFMLRCYDRLKNVTQNVSTRRVEEHLTDLSQNTCFCSGNFKTDISAKTSTSLFRPTTLLFLYVQQQNHVCAICFEWFWNHFNLTIKIFEKVLETSNGELSLLWGRGIKKYNIDHHEDIYIFSIWRTVWYSISDRTHHFKVFCSLLFYFNLEIFRYSCLYVVWIV